MEFGFKHPHTPGIEECMLTSIVLLCYNGNKLFDLQTTEYFRDRNQRWTLEPWVNFSQPNPSLPITVSKLFRPNPTW